MPAWKDEYLSALQERDKREKANQAFYDKSDRTATPWDGRAAGPSNEDAIPSPKSKDRKVSQERFIPNNPTSPDAAAKVRQDLSEAQRSRGLMETRLQTVTEDLNKLKMQTSLDSKRISELTKEKSVLSTRLRDRDEELKGKTKLLEDVHDETVSLTLQLNMAEEQSQKLQHENKELVDRWMARMGREADAMNVNSRFS
ncbi:hypothetical protein P7C71_g1178, partial [Lecanoromycetidae sp. Uapishka_2]